MPRIFIGLELPDRVKQALLQIRRELPGACWQSEQQLHLTLHFLGQVEPDALAELNAAMQASVLARIELGVRGVGSFSDKSCPRILWAGINPVETVHALHKLLGRHLLAAGFVLDSKAFVPHITLARLRRAGTVDGFLSEYATLEIAPFIVNHLSLFASTPGPGGSRYEVLARTSLSYE